MDKQSSTPSLMDLYEVGAHRGNKKSRLNPRLKNRTYGIDNGLTIIDLVETRQSISAVSNFLKSLGEKNKQVLVVGTSKHLTSITKDFAEKFTNGPMPYVNYRWLGGTLTNWSTVKKTLDTLIKLRSMDSNEEFLYKLSKNEQLSIKRKKVKLEKFFAGLVSLKSNKPGALIVLDSSSNPIAIKEAELMGIPVIALTNTGTVSLPENIEHTVVANINSIKTMKLLIETFVNAYNLAVVNRLEKSDKEKVKSH